MVYLNLTDNSVVAVLFTRCTYSQCIYTPRAYFHDFRTNTCGLLLVGVACGFRSCWCIASVPGSCVGGASTNLGTRLACATKCKKFEKEGKAYVLR